MTVLLHELKQGRKALIIWGVVIAFMLFICILMFPEMEKQMDSISEMFANMGGFTAAFGMDKIDFGTAMGFYGIECGNILGIGGGFFAALLGISSLSKEEKNKTAEFLLSHPITRANVVFQKFLGVIIQIVVLNVCVATISVLSFALIGEALAVREFLLLHLAYLIMQIEIACICFGISAFISRGSIGIGIGLAASLYFLNIIGNISDKADFVKYITPFKYSEASDIISSAKLDTTLILIGMAYAIVAVVIAFVKYTRKDIAN